MMVLTFYVPTENKETVKNALFKAGAGRLGNYDSCAFESEGTGQFRALEGANPTIGELGKLEKISETRVEIVFCDTILKEVISALKKSHPYETVAFNVFKSIDVE